MVYTFLMCIVEATLLRLRGTAEPDRLKTDTAELDRLKRISKAVGGGGVGERGYAYFTRF